MDIYQELQNLLKELRDDGVSYALCGGLALAVYGITRATEDIDLLVEETSLQRVNALGQRLGFRSNPTPLSLRDGAVITHGLFKRAGEEMLVLDLLLVTAAREPAWATRRVVQTDFGPVQVVSPQGLIHVKLLRRSGQDEDDIRRLKGLSDETTCPPPQSHGGCAVSRSWCAFAGDWQDRATAQSMVKLPRPSPRRPQRSREPRHSKSLRPSSTPRPRAHIVYELVRELLTPILQTANRNCR